MINVNSERAKDIAEILLNNYYVNNKGIFGLTFGNVPEFKFNCPPGMERGSNEHIIYLTLLMSLNYNRDAGKLWEAVHGAYINENYRWIFNVREINSHNHEDLSDVLQVSEIAQRAEQDVKIWEKISESILDICKGRLKQFIKKECDNDAVLLFYMMKFRYKIFFPFLSGDKILPLWIRFLKDYCHIKLKNLEKIMIPIDIHVARTTAYLGCISSDEVRSYKLNDIKYYIDKAWEKVIYINRANGNSFIKLDIDEPLWNLGRKGCTKMKNRKCPKSDKCPVSEFCLAIDIDNDINVNSRNNDIRLYYDKNK